LHKSIIRTPENRPALENMNDSSHIHSIIHRFPAISLNDMDRVRLMDRTDIKYLLHISRLPGILQAAEKLYQILEIGNDRIFEYHSLYFDTPDFRMYHNHHRGKTKRYKVRFRKYLQTNRVFLEVKSRKNNRRTRKKRIPVADVEHRLTPWAMDFIREYIPLTDSTLEPKLWTRFSRFTLVHLTAPERITIDLDLRVNHEDDRFGFPGLVIAEVKQEGNTPASDFRRILASEHIRPMGLSKYCLGCVLLYPRVKSNRYKQKLRIISKLGRHEQPHYAAANPAIVRN